MTTPGIDRLKEVAEGATPGPWEIQDGCSWRRIGTRDGDGNVLCPTNHPRDHHPDLCAGRGEDVYANLRHIATFDPPTVLALLARLKAAEEALEDHIAFFHEVILASSGEGPAWVLDTDGDSDALDWLAERAMLINRTAAAYFDTATAPDPDHAGRGE